MESKDEYVTYKICSDYIKGISDLESEYAFHGNSQGDDSKTNSVDEFIGSGGWKSVSSNFKDIDYLNQSEVDKRALEIRTKNQQRILELKRNGEYGKRVENEISLSIKTSPKFDSPKIHNTTLDSYRMIFIDFGNGK